MCDIVDYLYIVDYLLYVYKLSIICSSVVVVYPIIIKCCW